MARGGGRGGVIAGAEVKSEIGTPVTISTEYPAKRKCGAVGDRSIGNILIVTDKGSFTYPNVRCDILSAARRLTYETPAGLPAWSPGEAIGLASIDTAGVDPVFPVFVPANGDFHKIAARHRMLLHPALVDLDIGRAVAFLDLWPSARARLAQVADGDPGTLQWLRSLKGAPTWKWSDSPAIIQAHGKSIVVTPIRGETIMNLRTYTRDEIGLEQISDLLSKYGKKKPKELNGGRDSVELSAAIKSLRTNLPDAARAEELFKALAIFRWAKQAGAKLEGPAIRLEVSRPKTPDTLIVGIFRDYLRAGPPPTNIKAECNDVSTGIKALNRLPAETSAIERVRRDFAVAHLRERFAKMELLAPGAKLAISCDLH